MVNPDKASVVVPAAPEPIGTATPTPDALRHQRHQVWLLTAGAVALLLGAVSWFQWNERTQEIRVASALAERRVSRLAEELTQALQMAQAAITQAEDTLKRLPARASVAATLDELALDQAPLLATLPLPVYVQAVDARGRTIEPASNPALASAQDPEQLNSVVADTAATWVVAATQGADGARSVPLLRRAGPNAHGIAAFTAKLDHQALVRRLESSRLREGGGAAVFRVDPDGSLLLLARAPFAAAELGQRMRGPVAQALAKHPRGVFDATTQIDSLRRVVAYQRLQGDASNLVVTYGMETRSVLAAWSARLPQVAAITLVLAAGLLWGGWRLDRSLQALARGQQALQRSEKHFRVLAGNLPDVVTRFGTDGRLLYANPSVEVATGRPPQALVGKTYEELGMPAAETQRWTAALQQVFASGRAERFEVALMGPQGPRQWESLLALEPPVAGEGPTVLVISRDVTERQQVLEALRESEVRHRRLFEANPHAMWVYDLRTLLFLAVNDAAVAQYGYTQAEFLAMTIKDIRPAEDVPRMLASVAQGIQGIEKGGEWRHVRRSGELLEVEITAHAIEYMGRPAKLVLAHDVTQRHWAERALRESEERLRLALAATQQGLYDVDLRTGQAVVSPEYARMLGYEPGELSGSNEAWRERMHPDDLERATRAFDDYLAGRVPEYRVEFRQRTRQGGWKWILSMGSVESRDEAGRPLRLLGTHTDITVAREAQEALRHSEQRFRLAASHGQVWEWDFGAGGLQPTGEFFELLGFGVPAQGEQAACFKRLIEPADYQRMKAILSHHLKGLGPYHLQFRALDSQGRERWFETQGKAMFNRQGQATYMAGTTFEITERQQAEEAVRRLAADLEQRVHERTSDLARSEARYRAIFETVPVSIGEEDWSGVQQLLRELRSRGVSDGPAYFAAHPQFVQQCLNAVRILRLNRKGMELNDAHVPLSDLPHLQAFYPSPAQLPQFVGEIEALWEGQRQYTAKKMLPSLSGRPLQLMMTMSLPALDDADGTALVCLVDIGEIDRLNAELDRNLARLRQLNQELETFTYSVSHDLKAPLRGIDGYSRLLLNDHHQGLNEEGQRFLRHIRQATQNMGVLIDDLLAYSRLERRELTLSNVLLAPLVEAVLRSSRDAAAVPAVTWQIEVPTDLRARADTQGLNIALRNLVDNAIKFSHQQTAPRIRIVGTRVPGGVRLAVQDNGLGFDMKFHDRIFAIFQRLLRAEDYPGTGVGLAMVRKAMERMGGRVWAESKLGHGATFTLELPEAS